MTRKVPAGAGGRTRGGGSAGHLLLPSWGQRGGEPAGERSQGLRAGVWVCGSGFFFLEKSIAAWAGKVKKKKKIVLVKPDCEAAVVDGVAERLEGAVLTDSTGWGGGLWPGSAGNPERRGREEELHLVVLPASPRGCRNETNWREVNR